MSGIDPKSLAQELAAAYANRQPIAVPPSTRDPGFGIADGYAVEAEFVRLKRMTGRTTVGRKVGYANKAMWRVLKLETLVWSYMYDDTVRYATNGEASLSIGRMYSAKIEPEIIFKLKRPPAPEDVEPAAVLDAVEWLALGFEVIDCVYEGWSYQPADFLASFGLHAALIVGETRRIEPAMIPTLGDQLASFTVRLMKNGELVEEGGGKNVLRSPARCLAELAAAVSRQPIAEPLAAGELISTGSLTTSTPIAAGETWSAVVDGIDLPAVTLRV